MHASLSACPPTSPPSSPPTLRLWPHPLRCPRWAPQVLAWLRCKARQALAALAASSGSSIAALDQQQQLGYALGFLSEYISPGWHARLVEHCGVQPIGLPGGAGPTPVLKPVSNEQPAEKKPKVGTLGAALLAGATSGCSCGCVWCWAAERVLLHCVVHLPCGLGQPLIARVKRRALQHMSSACELLVYQLHCSQQL